MRRIYFVFFSFILIAKALDAQTIQGSVTNAAKEGIPYANITVLNSSQGTVADQNGNFTLTLSKGTYSVSAGALGYAKVIRQLSISEANTRLDFVLSESSLALGEVVVSAQKTEQNLLLTPVSITALNAQQVENTRTWDLSSLTGLVPNYLYQELGVGFQQIQSIRGIQVFSENPAVSTYIDDVNNIDILANGFALTDIERIEVLRGPQGTLFGRNAMGGVVNIITKKPNNQQTGFVEIGAGNLSLQRHNLGFKTPLIKDKLFLGLNGLFQTQEGYWKNDTSGTGAIDGSANGKTVGDEKNLYGNAYLTWLPAEKLSFTLNLKGQRDWSDNTGFFVSQQDYDRAFRNPDKINLARVGEHERNILNASLVAKYYLSNLTLTAISAYQTIGLSFKDIDFPGFYHSFYESAIGEKLPPQKVFSQELRIQSPSDGKLQYTLGIYGFSQEGYEPSTNLAFEFTPSSFAIFRNRSNNFGLAGFGEFSYLISPRLKATLGLRYDYEDREATFNGFGDAIFDNGQVLNIKPDTTVSGDYSALSPKFALSYTLGEQSSLYLTYNRGFRAGGVNAQRYPQGSGIRQTFDPEYSNNFEAGYKALLANKRLSVQSSVFLIQWNDLQFFNLAAPFTYARSNVGDAESAGLELELSAIPLKGLQADLSLGVNQTEYKEFGLKRVNFFTGEETTTPIGGNSLSNAPTHTLFLGLQYEWELNKHLTAVLRGEIRNTGKFYTDIQNSLEQPSYTLVNSRLGLVYRRFSLFFWGQNLTDETYLAFGTADTSFGTSLRTAAPRTLGATFSVKY